MNEAQPTHGIEGLCSLEGDDLLPPAPKKSTDRCPVGGCFECWTRYDKHMATMTDSLRQVHSLCYFKHLECLTPLAEPLYESQFCYMDDSDACRGKYQFGFYVGQAPAFLIVLFCFFKTCMWHPWVPLSHPDTPLLLDVIRMNSKVWIDCDRSS